MSKRNKKSRYVLLSAWYDYRERKYVVYKDYYSRNQLLSKIVAREVSRFNCESILNNLTTDISKVEHGKYLIGKEHDGEIESISIEKFLNDINKRIEIRKNKLDQLQKRRDYRIKAEAFKFRESSVPNVHKSHWHRGCYYRYPKLRSIKKSVYSSEYKEFTKGKDREASLLVWDDRVRHTDKSWKTSYKVRKQWQKHLPKHEDTIVHNKRQWTEEID